MFKTAVMCLFLMRLAQGNVLQQGDARDPGESIITVTCCKKDDPKCLKYKGTKSTTSSGKKCQAWNQQWPHTHGVTTYKYWFWVDTRDFETNYCRNPNMSGQSNGAWCYTMDKNIKWESCGIPTCSQDNYVDLYDHGKAFATSSWYNEEWEGAWDPKQAFNITGDGSDLWRYWSSRNITNAWEPTAIWFRFEEPKRVIKIKFMEAKYKLKEGGTYQVFASNNYNDCGKANTQTKLVEGKANLFSGGKEFQNEESYHCYGVRTYSYGQCSNCTKAARTLKVMALRRIQLRIEAPPNREISSKLVDISSKLDKLTNMVQLLRRNQDAHITTLKVHNTTLKVHEDLIHSTIETHGSRLTKVEKADSYVCKTGSVTFSADKTGTVKYHWNSAVDVKFGLEYDSTPKVHLATTAVETDQLKKGWKFHPSVITKTGFKAVLLSDDMYDRSFYEAVWIACGTRSI